MVRYHGTQSAAIIVAGLLLFHSHDEPALTGFQSGVYYVDGTAKSSLEPVRDAAERTICP